MTPSPNFPRLNIPLRGLLIALLTLSSSACRSDAPVSDSVAPFTSEVLAENLDQPWALAFLPDGSWLITQKPGQLVLITAQSRVAVKGVPDSVQTGQGGLLDVALHPRFADGENWVYLTYSDGEERYASVLGRGRLQRHRNGSAELRDWQELYRLPLASSRGHHFGSRIAFDRQGYLYFSIGDRGERERAQDGADAAGSILRLHADGRIPDDNPFVDQANVLNALFSIGHRNPQGLARDPLSGEIWAHEHGPQGGDEVNRIQPGKNYGWPVITYGKEYGSGFDIGEGSHKDGMQQPLHVWVPSIAPSGMAFYQGDAFADWQGDLLVGALKAQRLVRLQREQGRIVGEFRYIPGTPARIRDVRVGPDGQIYLLTDARNGQLIRLRPTEAN